MAWGAKVWKDWESQINPSKDAWQRAGRALTINLPGTDTAFRNQRQLCFRLAPASPPRATQPHRNTAAMPTAVRPDSFPQHRRTSARNLYETRIARQPES